MQNADGSKSDHERGPALATPEAAHRGQGEGRSGWKRRGPARLLAASSVLLAAICLLAVAGLVMGVLRLPGTGDGAQLDVFASPTPAMEPTRVTGMDTPAPTPSGHGNPGASAQGCAPGARAPLPSPLPVFAVDGRAGSQNEVALTFDDGPSPYTLQVLATLKAWDTSATFFLVGRHAQQYPEIVRDEWLAGHALGNHTYSHIYLAGQSRDRIQSQVSVATSVVTAITSDRCLWLFRPPYGALSGSVLAEARSQGFTTALWDVQAEDWLLPGSSVIADRIIAGLHPGAIILLHDGAPDGEYPNRAQTVAALPFILAAIRARGLHAVTLPRLLFDASAVTPPFAFSTTARWSPGMPSSKGTGGAPTALRPKARLGSSVGWSFTASADASQ